MTRKKIVVLKRDGRKVNFDPIRIISAMEKAYQSVYPDVQSDDEFYKFSSDVAVYILHHASSRKEDSPYSVEMIQDIVERKLMASKYKDVAKEYITYRKERTDARENTIDKTVNEIVGHANDYWNNENSNKDANLATTQRDYIAGAISTDESKRLLLPKDVVKAHDEGIIHFHDMDYYLQTITNCCLVNLEDMLQNGTVISKVKIDRPHKFSTACNIATQIIAQVASSQYGLTRLPY